MRGSSELSCLSDSIAHNGLVKTATIPNENADAVSLHAYKPRLNRIPTTNFVCECTLELYGIYKY